MQAEGIGRRSVQEDTVNISDYQHIETITPATIPWTDFYTDPFAAEIADDTAHTYLDSCGRCGGDGRGPWIQDGGICYKCWGKGKWQVSTTVGERRQAARKAAQDRAGAIRKQLKIDRAAAAELRAATKAYPALVWLDWNGVRHLADTGVINDWAYMTLTDILDGMNRRAISPKQAAFAAKLITEGFEKAQVKAAKEAGALGTPAPEGKLLVTGTVESVWTEESNFGYQRTTVWKMSVVTEAGWKVKTTIDKKISDGVDAMSELRGRKVEFIAELNPWAKDPEVAYTKGRKSKIKLHAAA
jgi:hypothetical protein